MAGSARIRSGEISRDMIEWLRSPGNNTNNAANVNNNGYVNYNGNNVNNNNNAVRPDLQ